MQMNKVLWIDYTNHKGQRRIRPIFPTKLIWGATEYHPKEQWLLEAIDLETVPKNVYKLFAFSGIHQCGGSKESLEDRSINIPMCPLPGTILDS
jgi:hypothetical protein